MIGCQMYGFYQNSKVAYRGFILPVLFLLVSLRSAVCCADFSIDESRKAWPSSVEVEWQSSSRYVPEVLFTNTDECALIARSENDEIGLYISFPSSGGVRIRSEHAGFFEPETVLPVHYPSSDENSVVVLEAGGISAKILTNQIPWAIEMSSQSGTTFSLRSDRLLFGAQNGVLKKIKMTGAIHRNEILFGLGERFNALNQIGWRVQLWNHDAYNGLMAEDGDKTKGYKNVPILHSSCGWSLFFNSFYSAVADIGQKDFSEWSLDFNGSDFDVYFWLDGPQENLKSYTALTGHPVLPPRWALQFYAGAGGQVWKERGEDQYLDVLRECMEKYHVLGTPIAALYGEGLPCKNPQGYDVVVREYGSRMLYWYWSAMGLGEMMQRLPSVAEQSLPIVRMSSDPGNIMKGAYIDFSNPLGADLIYDKFKPLWALGCRGSMVDFGDNIYEDSIFYNGMTGDEMHNAYAWFYNKGFHDAWERGRSEGLMPDGYILFSRSGTAGSQRWVGQFAGDHSSDFTGLRQAILGGLNAGAAGFSLWGSDIGGYGRDHRPPSPDCYIRWLEFGTFCPLMRLHGTTDRNPWMYGEAAVDVFKTCYWLRENLLDTLYSSAIEAHQTGLPMIQSMPLAFSDQPWTFRDDQYLFCDRFLVAPVIAESATERTVAFPAGKWVDLWTGNIVEGGAPLTVDAPQSRIPVYLAAGSVSRIQVAPSLTLADPMTDQRVDALLVAAGGPRVSKHWKNETEASLYTVTNGLAGELMIELPKDDPVSSVIVLGKRATAVRIGTVDLPGIAVCAQDSAGFVVENDLERTVIRLPDHISGTLVLF